MLLFWPRMSHGLLLAIIRERLEGMAFRQKIREHMRRNQRRTKPEPDAGEQSALFGELEA